jgi:hypothetical protein
MASLLTPPKAENKFPLVNFPNIVYPRMTHAVLEVKNREKLFQQNRADDSLCANQACRNEGLAQIIEHVLCSCYRVRTAWHWIKQKMLYLMSDQGPVLAASNTEIILLMYPTCRKEVECTFLLETFIELVDREVICKQKELLINTVKGVLRARLEQNHNRAVPEVLLPMNWL